MDLILSLMMLAALALGAGGAYLWLAKGVRKQGGLMLLLALIMLINVAIWTVPDASGGVPLDRAERLTSDR